MVERNSEDKAYIRANIERLERMIKECVESESNLIPRDKIEIILKGYRKALLELSEE